MSLDIFNKILESKDSVKVEEKVDEKVEEKAEEKIEISKTDNKKNEEKETDLEKLERMLKDTQRVYHTTNQKYVLAKKKFNNTLKELESSLLNEDNTLLEEEELKTSIAKLQSIFDHSDEDNLDNIETVKNNKSEKILSNLEAEIKNYKKYNKSKDLEINYKAFYDSVHLLDAEQKNNLIEYLEEAEPTDAVEKIIIMGKDYRELFEDGLKKHKNIFAYVSSLKNEIKKLNEEINTSKENIDNNFKDEDNKNIKHRATNIENIKANNSLVSHVLSALN